VNLRGPTSKRREAERREMRGEEGKEGRERRMVGA